VPGHRTVSDRAVTTKNPSKFKQGREDRNELDRYAEMDDAKAREMVQILVAHHVALVPTF
jgi:hypothetical protein